MDGGVVLFSLTNLLYNRVYNFSIAFFVFPLTKGEKRTIIPSNLQTMLVYRKYGLRQNNIPGSAPAEGGLLL
jgi:hypothetical protein